MSRILIAYYSRTGFTRRVANALAARLTADLLPIEDVRPRQGIRGDLRSAFEALRGSMPRIVPPVVDPGHYRFIVLGTPARAGHVSSPMRRFLHDHAGSLRHVAFFCTQGGRGAEQVFREMSVLSGREPDTTCALTASEILNDQIIPALDRFILEIERGRNTSLAETAVGVHAGG